jgi:DNA topoisomerase-1
VAVLDTVSELLGNTRSVCKKYYVHPILLSKYEAGDIDKYLTAPNDKQQSDSEVELSADEKLVLKILESS